MFRQGQPILKLGRKPKKLRNSLIERANSEMCATNEIETDVKKMKHYIFLRQR